MRTSPHRWIVPALVLSASVIAGCEVAVGPDGPPPPGVVIGPGYYYDEAYVDVGGVYHPREYWYHDDHGWSHRAAVPAGIAAHDRAGFGYVHGAAPHGDGRPADHGGGGGEDGGGHGGR